MPLSRVRYIFTYGSLKSDAICAIGSEERAVLRERAQYIAKGTIAGLLFDVGPYPGAILEGRRTARVHGEIWQLPCVRGELMAMLDRYEGCAASSPIPHTYARRKVRILLNDGRRVVAWMYLWNGAVSQDKRIRSGIWEGPGRTLPRKQSQQSTDDWPSVSA